MQLSLVLLETWWEAWSRRLQTAKLAPDREVEGVGQGSEFQRSTESGSSVFLGRSD